MKIALFADTYPPRINGVATSVLMLKTNLEAMGHEILIVTSADPNAPHHEPDIIRIPSVPFKTERLATVANPLVYRDIIRFAPDIIHTHSEWTLGILGRAIAVMLEKPHVHTMHTAWEYYTKHIINIDVLEPAMNQAARRYTALICNRADRVIVPTGKVEDLLRSYRVRKQINIIPTGINLKRFSPERCTTEQLQRIRAELGIKENEKVLINVCRVEREKNLSELFTALSSYLILRDNVKFVIVGDGTARKELEEYANILGVPDKIIFAGKRPWDEVNRYYRSGDVFVCASQSETQGLTYAEAMASGLPVVARRDRCLDDLLIEGENGYMYDNPRELIIAVDKLLGDEEQRRSFSEKAIQSANKLSDKAYADNVLAVYNEFV